MNLHFREFWFNFGEDGFFAYWWSKPWRCRFGSHKRVEMTYREVPDYPWIVKVAVECERCGDWFGWVE